jgi:hypothetical protein
MVKKLIGQGKLEGEELLRANHWDESHDDEADEAEDDLGGITQQSVSGAKIGNLPTITTPALPPADVEVAGVPDTSVLSMSIE